ncbi:hypothetical protein Tco_0475499 [Tanacetum coccineum]
MGMVLFQSLQIHQDKLRFCLLELQKRLYPEKEREKQGTPCLCLPEDHLASSHKMTDARKCWDAIIIYFGGNDEPRDAKVYLEAQFEGFLGIQHRRASQRFHFAKECRFKGTQIIGEGMHGILETRMGAELDKRRILRHWCQLMEKIVIMLEPILIGNPQQEVVNFLAGDSSLGNAKSRPLWPLLLQKQKSSLSFQNKAHCYQTSLHQDAYEKKLIQLFKIHTDDNVADLLTKAFDVSRFQFLVVSIRMIFLSSTMTVLDSCPKHNMVAYLEKTEGNVEFHEIIDFLKRSSIHHALTVSPVVSTTFVEQFWTSAKSKTINNVRHITAKVAGKKMQNTLLISAIFVATIFDAIQQMGSKSTSWDQIPTNIATAVICLTSNQKYNFSKLIFDGKQLANVSVPLDHFPVNILTSKVFSFMVKKGKHFSGKVTPLFASMLVLPTQDEGASSERPSEALPTPSPAPTSEVPNDQHIDSTPAQTSEVPIEQLTDKSPRPSPTTSIPDSIPEASGENLGGHSSSDKSLSGTEGDMTLQSVYDLCLSLCAQVSDQAKEIQDLRAQITKLKKQAKPVIKHHKAYLKSVFLKQRFPRRSFSKKHRVHKEYVSKQGRKNAKGESSVQRDPLFDEVPEGTVDHMDTENAQDEGRKMDIVDEDKELEENVLSTDKEGVSTDIGKVSTDRPIVSTDKHIEGTDEQVEGTEENIGGTEEKSESTDGHKKGTEEEIAVEVTQTFTQTSTQTPTSTIFRDDETIAKVLLNMSQAKAVSREKEKGVELKDVEETDRPKPTSTRSLLTLKPLPKIDPKDKGKKKIEEEDESESESDGIPQAEKKFKQLESDEELARKMQEEWEAEEERNRIAEEKAANEALIRNFDNIKARIKADRLLAEKHQEQERQQFTE